MYRSTMQSPMQGVYDCILDDDVPRHLRPQCTIPLWDIWCHPNSVPCLHWVPVQRWMGSHTFNMCIGGNCAYEECAMDMHNDTLYHVCIMCVYYVYYVCVLCVLCVLCVCTMCVYYVCVLCVSCVLCVCIMCTMYASSIHPIPFLS